MKILFELLFCVSAGVALGSALYLIWGDDERIAITAAPIMFISIILSMVSLSLRKSIKS